MGCLIFYTITPTPICFYTKTKQKKTLFEKGILSALLQDYLTSQKAIKNKSITP